MLSPPIDQKKDAIKLIPPKEIEIIQKLQDEKRKAIEEKRKKEIQEAQKIQDEKRKLLEEKQKKEERETMAALKALPGNDQNDAADL